MLNAEQLEKILDLYKTISAFIVKKATDAGTLGVPSGHVYAALNASGVPLDLYNACLELTVESGKVEVRNHCIHLKGSN